MVTTAEGNPVEVFLTPGSYNDTKHLRTFELDLPEGSVLYGDKAYNEYFTEDLLADASNIELLPHLADRLCDQVRGLVRRAFRTARVFFEPIATVFAIAVQPLVAGFPANVKPAAKSAHIGRFLVGKCYEFELEGHLGSVVPGHGHLRLFGGEHATGNVLPQGDCILKFSVTS